MNKYRWAMKELQWLGRRSLHAITGNYFVNADKYANVGITSDIEANERIYNGLMGDAPFAVGRTGFAEIGFMCCAQNEIYYNSKVHYRWTPSYITGLDFFLANNTESGSLKHYHEIMLDAMDEVDGIGTYRDMFMCDAVFETVPSIGSKTVFRMDVLTSLCDHTGHLWTEALKDRKVLVVSPFYNEIRIQHGKLPLIWKDGRMPHFDIDFDPSIWVREFPGGYFKALECITERVLAKDFDIALLGCSDLGLPLAASIKKSGRKAVQLGSMIHILFGLKGKRWDDLGIYNDYWIRPGEETKPSYADKIDGATYW